MLGIRLRHLLSPRSIAVALLKRPILSLILAFFLVTIPCSATAAKVFNNSNMTASSSTISVAGNTSTGSTLLVGVCVGAFGGTLSMSDSKTNSWVQIGTQVSDAGSTVQMAFFYVKNPTVGTSHSFTCSSGTVGVGVWALGFSGTDTTANVLCSNSTDNGSSTSGNTGSCSPSTNTGSVFVAMTTVSSGGNASLSVNSTFSLLDFSNFGVTYDARDAYKIQTGAAASENPLFSTTPSEEKLCFIAGFKANTSLAFTASTKDTLLPTQSATGLGSHFAIPNDVLVPRQSASGLAAHFATTSEATPVTDSPSGLGAHFAKPTENVPVTQVASGLGTHFASTTDIVPGKDSASGLGAHFGTSSDSLIPIQSAAGLANHFASTKELTPTSQSPAGLGAHFGTFSDVLAPNQSASGAVGHFASSIELLPLRDSPVGSATIFVHLTAATNETIGAIDSGSGLAAHVGSTVEYIAASDATTRLLTALRSMSDTAPVFPPTYSQDSFTDSTGIRLTNHQPDIGPLWNVMLHPTQWLISSNQLSRTQTGNDHAWVDLGVTDMRASANFVTLNGLCSVIVRRLDGANYWEIFYDVTNHGWQLDKVVASVDNFIGPLMSGTTGRATLIAQGNTITAISPTGDMRQVVDSALNTQTQAGLIMNGTGLSASLIDDWLATGSGEVAFPARTAHATPTELVPVLDARLSSAGFARTPSEVIPAVDLSARSFAPLRSASEAIAALDMSSRVFSPIRATVENLPVIEAPRPIGSFFRSSSDVVRFLDSGIALNVILRAGSEMLIISDAAVRNFGAARAASDTGLLSESAGRLLGSFRSSADSTNLSEAVTRFSGFNRALADGSIAETMTRSYAALRNLADTTLTSETIARIAGHPRSISDGTITVTVMRSPLVLNRTLADGTVSEILLPSAGFFRAATDLRTSSTSTLVEVNRAGTIIVSLSVNIPLAESVGAIAAPWNPIITPGHAFIIGPRGSGYILPYRTVQFQLLLRVVNWVLP